MGIDRQAARQKPVEGELEPRRECVALFGESRLDDWHVLPLPVVHFTRVGGRRSLEPSGDHVIVFVLHQAAVQYGSIHEAEYRVERAVETHLLVQPPMGRLEERLARARVAAARVGP